MNALVTSPPNGPEHGNSSPRPTNKRRRAELSGPKTGTIRKRTSTTRAADNNATSLSSASNVAATLDTLPIVALRQVGAFAGACFPLGETRKRNLAVTRELHYKISINASASDFSVLNDPLGALSSGHMGVRLSGGLATGRVVTRITVTGCTDLGDTQGGYQALEKAVKRVVQLSIPTLRSISVKGRRSRDASRVAAILEELVPLSAKAYRVAPKLTRVELCHSATAFSKAGKAIAAGLWPALEELVVPSCHANLGHTKKLVLGLRSGRAPNLRTLNWDEQANTRCRNGYKNLNDAILSAVSAGKCPRIERLAFTFAPRSKPSVKAVMYTLRDCPTLRELRIKFKRRFSLGDRRVTFTVVRAEAAGAGQALRYSCSLSLQGRPRVSDPTH